MVVIRDSNPGPTGNWEWIEMDKELKQELEWINENLKSVMSNQTAMYQEITKIEKKQKKEE